MIRLSLVLTALIAAGPAAAATFVLDDFGTPAPLIAIDSPTGTIAAPLDVEGPYGRSLLAQSYVAGPVSYRVGNGEFVRRPATGSTGDTLIYYGAFAAHPVLDVLDLSAFHHLRLDFNDVTGGDAQNLVTEFYNSTPTPEKPIYYGLAGINWLYSTVHRSAYLPLDPAKAGFDFSHVQGLRVLFDQSGSGVDGFALDRIAFTTGIPEPASWAMMVAGFGLVGAMRRRSRGVTVAA